MIFFASLDRIGPIKLFQQKKARHIMGKGHQRQGEQQISLRYKLL
jgi:hypothetical protein